MTNATIQATPAAAHDTTEAIFAQPYNGDFIGFSFSTQDEYDTRANRLRVRGCDEFELSYLDGDHAELFAAAGVCQGNIGEWLELIDELEDYNAPAMYHLMSDLGLSISEALEQLEDVMVFEGTATEYTEELMDECGELDKLSATLRYYIDFEALGRDMKLNSEITEVRYNGTSYIMSGV